MNSLRDLYAQKALCQIPRLLSSQDRNPFSPTYGCMNREYWLCRATDFPSSIAQFGTHALALVYAHEMPGNLYYQHPKILQWTIAGVDYWIRIQHKDGSFDEFYPNERGWAGPTGFLVYAMCGTYRLVGNHFPEKLKERFLQAIHRAGVFLSRTDESGVLANHHAMAILPMYEAYLLTQDTQIEKAFNNKLDLFFSYVHEEGWCLEYDGADPGYLSATISFMAKLAKLYSDERFDDYFQKWVEFSSYFVYPNGHYAGTIGSRQTLHFYPHGYECLTEKIPLAASIADKMLIGLREGGLVPPEIQGERYFVYRIPELLLSYVDYGKRSDNLPPVPYERDDFRTYFQGARIAVEKSNQTYTVINAAKGGVVKHFVKDKLGLNDCGIIGILDRGLVFTSQWIDPAHKVDDRGNEIEIRGHCHKIPTKVFTPWKFILFRLGMLLLGGHEKTAYWLKGFIRKLLMTGLKPVPVRFQRNIKRRNREIEVQTQLWLEGNHQVKALHIGDEFPARYVPQSRYFQPQELDVQGYTLSPDEITHLNQKRILTVVETYHPDKSETSFTVLNE